VPRNLAHRYAAWLDFHRVGILVLSLLVAIGCGYLGARLPVRTDLTKLLPESKQSVQNLAAVQLRARSFGTVHVVVESADPALRERAGAALIQRLATLGPDQVVAFSRDDSPLHQFAWNHRFLLAPLADLEAARDALQARVDRAKLHANPLYVSFDDDDDADRPAHDRLSELESKLAELESKAGAPPRRVSKDGHLELLVLQTAFPSSDYDRSRKLTNQIEALGDEVVKEVGPGVTVGLAGNTVLTLEEHDSVLEGMSLSIGLTLSLCALALLLYYRSGRVVLAMLWALGVGVSATFALALLVVGHLDMMSAFLIAIVVGNGLNAGLILVARYLEEVRGGRAPKDAVGPAIAGALHGTLAATATAAIAYGSLVVTDFRGFRHFGMIAGIGMTLTWITTFTVLPALLFVLARRGRIHASRPPAIGRVLSRLLPRRHLGTVVVVGTLITLCAGVITTRYIIRDPFTKDWRDLQSTTQGIAKTRAVGKKVSEAFDSGAVLSGQAYQVVIAVDRRDQLGPLITQIRAADAARPPDQRWLKDIRSLDDLVPPDQARKLAVLAEIRALIDAPIMAASLEEADRAKLLKVRPPETLPRIVDADVPHDLMWPFIERNGLVGRLAVLRGSSRLDSFSVADRLRFAAEIRRLELPPGTLAAGEALVVADIIETMESDAPVMIGLALIGSILAVCFVIGVRRHGIVTIVCGLSGVVVMIALCALAGLHVHFVDLIALPITIGIGIDYAVNLAVRDREDGELGPHHLLSTTGGSVLMCSYTTSVGYATLLLSANGGIRAFGLAALLGEISCIAIALLVGPALFALLRRRSLPPTLLGAAGGRGSAGAPPATGADRA